MLKRILSHTVIYGLAPYIIKLASFFILPIITKDLTSNDYGVVGLIGSYIGLFSVLNTLGLPVILSNTYIKHNKYYLIIWRHIYGFLSWWNILYGIIVALLLLFFLRNVITGNDLFLVVLLSIGPIIFFGPTQAIGALYFQLNKKPIQVVWRTILFGLLTIALNVYTITYLKLGFMGWLWSDFIVSVLFNISYWWALNVSVKISPIYHVRWKSIVNYLKVSLPVIPHQYSSFLLRSSDRAVLGFLKIPTGDIGSYSLASNFGNYFYSISSAFSTAINPFILSDLKNNNLYRVRSLIHIIQIVMLGLTFTFSLWSKEVIMYLIRNDELQKVYPLVIIIVMAFSYRPMYIGAVSVLFFYEKTKALVKVSFIAGIGNVIINLLLIPKIGYTFAAFSTFICYMYVGYSGYFLSQYKKHTNVNFYPLVWLSITIGLTVLAYFAVELNVIAKAWVTILIGSILLFAILKLKRLYERADR